MVCAWLDRSVVKDDLHNIKTGLLYVISIYITFLPLIQSFNSRCTFVVQCDTNLDSIELYSLNIIIYNRHLRIDYEPFLGKKNSIHLALDLCVRLLFLRCDWWYWLTWKLLQFVVHWSKQTRHMSMGAVWWHLKFRVLIIDHNFLCILLKWHLGINWCREDLVWHT